MSESDKKGHSPATARKANKLEHETSTYLLQHAYNPVQWYPWGPEALERSRAEDKPILLSIGYSACHWCHVMEHESFEDESTAEIMNTHFVNIKVDREERPDLDEIYMKSVQLLTGHGGWPMTVFLTPDLKPFYAGTYFPPQDKHGMPSFKRIMHGVINAWASQRSDIEESSADITRHIDLLDKTAASDKDLNDELLLAAVQPLLRVFDKTWGGFGSAPKFPHTASLSFAMRQMKRGRREHVAQHHELSEMIETTLNRMAWGGIHDQLGGGFARYSVDRKWLIPHFEKMLYDNALIPRNFLDGYLITNNHYWLDVARDTLDFVLRELLMPEGGFYCSLDADSEGEEGKYYVWKPEEIHAILGKEEGEFFCKVFDVSERGNFEHGSSALNFPEGTKAAMAKVGMEDTEFWTVLNSMKYKVLEAREKRVRPGRDDKMLTSWSSLMISCLVEGYRVIGDKKYLAAAVKAATFILDKLYQNGRLLRTYGRGVAKLNAYLEDYAYLIQALLDLASCEGSARWLSTAINLNNVVIEHFWDKENVGFFFTSDDHEELITRTKHFFDGSTPSATSVSAMNLLRLSRITGDEELLNKSVATMKAYAAYFHKAPDQFSNLLCAVDSYVAKPVEIAVVFDDATASGAHELLLELRSWYLPNAVVLLANKSADSYSALTALTPLLADRGLHEGRASVYICENFACKQPITDRNELRHAITELLANQL